MALSLSRMQENIIGDINEETPIYRVFPRKWFLELIKNSNNGLVKPRVWDDPFENAFLKCTAVMDSGEEASLEKLREKWYGQCWTTEKDTDAMWRIYSPNKDGVRVKTTVKKIFSHLWNSCPNGYAAKSCFIGKVEYKSREEIEKAMAGSYVQNLIFNEKVTARTLLIKRREFDHEKEVRILFHDMPNSGTDAVHQYKVELNDTLEEVTVDPRADPEEVDKLAIILKDLGLKAPVNQSNLYSFTPMKINFSANGESLPITFVP